MAAKKSFLLRLNQEMWDELERMAADDFRSVNGQIESILHEAISRRRKKTPAAMTQAGPPPPTKEEQ
ncbi:MAG: Arc family DNA-binding protein [Chrysiogenales bacterium]